MGVMIGQQLGNYQVLEKIGSGGFGEVYRAHEITVDREVAIKVILPEYASKPEFQQRFETEARLVAKLEHPHIIPLYNFWQDDQGAFLVMRYVRGGSLREIIRKQGALSLTQTTRIIGQITDALFAAHEAGVIHRDLKPENILLDIHGNAYLTDFGIAKQANDPHQVKETDGVIGTLPYLSPEQLQGREASPQSDIYALGIVLYEMLVGEHPFGDVPISMLITKHLRDPLPDLPSKRPDLPITINTTISRSTAKSPEDRYETAQGMALALHESPIIVTPTLPLRIPEKLAAPPVPSTPAGRNRMAMIQNVRKFWVEGVLENSLYGTSMIELGLQSAEWAVEHPWDTQLLTPEGGPETLPRGTRVADVFDKLNGKVLILGDPGSGKTTILLELARDLLRRAEYDLEHPIPVVFNLSSWGESRKPLVEWLAEELNGKYHVPRKVAKEWAEDDALLLMLDGLDEVAADQRNACVEAINIYRNEHGFVDVIVCSRIKDYEALTKQLHLNGAIMIHPLDTRQIEKYLANLGAEAAVVRELLTKDEALRELAASPLMLNMMILAFRGVSTGEIPAFDDVDAQRQHLFERYVQRVITRARGGTKAYSAEQIRHYLSWLAQRMAQHGKSIFHIEDLQPSWLNKTQYLYYRVRFRQIFLPLSFAPLAFLPYFILQKESVILGGVSALLFAGGFGLFNWLWISKYLKNWIAYLLGLGSFGILVGLAYGIRSSFTIDATLFWGAFLRYFLVFYLYFYLMERAGFRFSKIKPVESAAFSWSGVRWWMVIILFIAGSTVGLGEGSIVGAIGSGLVAAIIGFLVGGFVPAELSTRLQPNQGILNSHRNGISVGLLFATGSALSYLAPTLVNRSLAATSVAHAIGIFIFMAAGGYFLMGGYPAIQHAIIRRIFQRESVMPVNYAHFLDYAASLVLLRKVGGGYIFIHRYLLEYFAAQAK